MIKLYGDVSGKAHQHKAIVAAAYLGTEKRWDRVEADWDRALSAAGISKFHATKYNAREGEFKGWDAESKQYKRFGLKLAAIAETSLLGFGNGLEVDGFNHVLAPEFANIKTLHGKWTPLMQVVAKLLNDIARSWARQPREPIAALFEQEDGLGEAMEYFGWVKRKRREPWTRAFASIGEAHVHARPLEVADLLAHESWRRVSARMRGEGDDLRPIFARLIRRKNVSLTHQSEADMRKDIPAIREWLASHPEGTVYTPPKKRKEHL